MKGEAQTRDLLLQGYVVMTREKLEMFKISKVEHIPREQNTREDVLSKLTSMRGSEINHSFIQETLKNTNIKSFKFAMIAIDDVIQPSLTSFIKAYIKQGILLLDASKATLMRRRFDSYYVIEETL